MELSSTKRSSDWRKCQYVMKLVAGRRRHQLQKKKCLSKVSGFEFAYGKPTVAYRQQCRVDEAEEIRDESARF